MPGQWALLGLGIGLGFLLAGLLLISVPNEPSREEIVSRAREYGMVFREEVVPFDLKSPSASDVAPDTASADKPGQPGDRGNSTQHLPQDHEEVLVTIPPGATLEEIASLLEKQGVVSGALLEAEARRAGVIGKLKAGSYYLPRGDVTEILKRLTE
ncbi:hypothetical protein [Thermanaeromonas sp.]|uniref:hypothetical protein n=1 Tax=Thermanaeromonas sp. TaxID=2003697 RepID=UPI00262E63D1|nr:hypothetical protein [Thermanaeromonas sp.]